MSPAAGDHPSGGRLSHQETPSSPTEGNHRHSGEGDVAVPLSRRQRVGERVFNGSPIRPVHTLRSRRRGNCKTGTTSQPTISQQDRRDLLRDGGHGPTRTSRAEEICFPSPNIEIRHPLNIRHVQPSRVRRKDHRSSRDPRHITSALVIRPSGSRQRLHQAVPESGLDEQGETGDDTEDHDRYR